MPSPIVETRRTRTHASTRVSGILAPGRTSRPTITAAVSIGIVLVLAGIVLGFAPPLSPVPGDPAHATFREYPTLAEILISLVILFASLEIYQRAPKKLRWLGIALSVAASLRYLTWRVTSTLLFDTPADSVACVLLLGAEIYALGMLLLGHFQTFWPRTRRTPGIPAGATLPSVDVFITTYNEEVDLVRRTAVACAALDWPDKQVWILDDGRRPEMKELAREVGVRYVDRPDNRHAKAGNLNHALTQTRGELIAQFDADHVPVRSFLRETVPFFLHDPKLAFVQTPHHFYNYEAFQRNLAVGSRVANEQDLFFHVIQPGNDRWNAAFFCGSNAVLRRNAIEDVGGFATETVTEDAHTALRMHGRGWRSAYFARNLAGGLAAETFGDLVQQRLRWGMGMCSILRVDNPMFMRGLKLSQRVCYLAATAFFFYGLPRLFYFLAPVCYLLLGVSPIDAGILKVATYYLPHFLSAMFLASAASGNIRHGFWSEVYEAALAVPMSVATVWALCTRKKLPFKVTPKGASRSRATFNLKPAWPQALLLVLTLAAAALGLITASGRGERAGVLVMNMAWCAYNTVLLVAAVLVAVDRPQKRREPRVPCALPVQLAWHARGAEIIQEAMTVDLSESGAQVLTSSPVPAEAALELHVGSGRDQAVVPARVVSTAKPEGAEFFAVSMKFEEIATDSRHKLIRLMYGNPRSWVDPPAPDPGWSAFAGLVGTLFRWSRAGEKALLRRTARVPLVRKALLRTKQGPVPVTLADLSESGARAVGKSASEHAQPGSRVTLSIPMKSGKCLEIPARIVRAARGGLGLCFLPLSAEVRGALLWEMYVTPQLQAAVDEQEAPHFRATASDDATYSAGDRATELPSPASAVSRK